ncbi:MAG: winged helix-turn-helix transcriptional regulator [Egibacteraceae bacterium]
MSSAKVDPDHCPAYNHAVEIIGRRWAGAIVRAMLSGATRFTEIRAAIPGIADRVLSRRLKELEADGILIRQVHPETPVRIEYRLTDKGHALGGVVDAISAWANDWAKAPSTRH